MDEKLTGNQYTYSVSVMVKTKDTDLTIKRLENLAKLVVDDWDMDVLLSYAREQVFQNYQYDIDCAVTDAEAYDLKDLDE